MPMDSTPKHFASMDDLDPQQSEAGAPRSDRGSSTIARSFVALCIALLLVPFVAVPFVSTGASAEKKELSAFPDLQDENGFNYRYLSDLGSWFDDHFAFRSQLVDLDATIKEKLFLTSSTQNVVVGQRGWLYYSGTLDDYRRSAPLSDRAIDNIAYNLELISAYLDAQGKGFVFTIAPNKATLYPEQMPYYQLAGSGKSDLERLVPLLEDRGIPYVDLQSLFSSKMDKVYYFARDSHWNNEGALLAYDALMASLNKDALRFGESAPSSNVHSGDVDAMLHPYATSEEEQPFWPDSLSFTYTNGATSVEDSVIETSSTMDDAQGTVLVYRDSFGNALLPYIASTYDKGIFTKMVPYDMGMSYISSADDIIMERAERHLSYFNSNPPYLPAPLRRSVTSWRTVSSSSTLRCSSNGPYLVIEGDLDRSFCEDGAPIYVALDLDGGGSPVFEAFHVGNVKDSIADYADEDHGDSFVRTDYGFRAYVPMAALGDRNALRARAVVPFGGEYLSIIEEELSIGG